MVELQTFWFWLAVRDDGRKSTEMMTTSRKSLTQVQYGYQTIIQLNMSEKHIL